MMKNFVTVLFILLCGKLLAQNTQNNPSSNHASRFEQLGTILPSPNEYRTASGAPGNKYWQQRVDYDIACTLDEKNLQLNGSELITYFNNSPDVLRYLWLQLDENQQSNINNANYQSSNAMPGALTDKQLLQSETAKEDNGFGDKIEKITDALGKPLAYTINKTMMRVELPELLKPGQKFAFRVNWHYKIPNRMEQGGRGGYEYFAEEGNHLFTMTQWYPRLCVYSDFQGWQNNQFTGRGEFALTFGNFKVAMTVPADHVICATGECQNYAQVLSPAQLARWKQAQTAKEPTEVVTLDEAKKAEPNKATANKTWIFNAVNVRDFAWGSSRKFIWDAMPQMVEGKKVMCMSFYPKEAYGLYKKYSTKVVAHTIKSYSKFTIPYPYPVAQSIEASNGMEYPMICFNFGRTEKDGTYSEGTKNGMIGVVIHEVGHNFFPMIINSDERQWSWMDEGLNSFVEYLTEELWDNKFPTRKGPAYTIVDYMKLPKEQLEPIMTNSENIVQFGPNAYSKPATGLNILRETIMGRELFDYAFKEYARRWAFKHPTPADFFRTMNDASAENLDWFWRGWFYGTDACDISLDSVKHAVPDFSGTNRGRMVAGGPRGGGGMGRPSNKIDPPIVNSFEDVSKIRNKEDKNIKFQTDVDTSLRDFYWRYDRGIEQYDSAFTFTPQAPAAAAPAALPTVDEDTKAKLVNKHLYELSFSNKGGLVMPIIIEWTYKDGTKEVERIPAQVWRLNEKSVTKSFVKEKEVANIKLDPMRETADIDATNNSWGSMGTVPSKVSVFKQSDAFRNRRNPQSSIPNPMQRAAENKKGF